MPPRGAGRLAAVAVGIGLAATAVAIASAQTDRVQQYLGLARATLKEPVTAAELERAVLSADGIEDVASLFESSLAAAITLDDLRVAPELGGEATLEKGRLRFVTYDDSVHPVVRRMVELQTDPAGLLSHLAGSPAGQHVLATTGGLHAVLYQMTTQPPGEVQWRALRQAIRAAVQTHFKTWSVSPEGQQAAIARHEWRGRYAGFWHLHPARPDGGGYAPGVEPSFEDMTLAVEKGQFLTLVFQPDGFDLYDLAPLAEAGVPSLSAARVVRHRSPAWKRRFGALIR